MDTRLVITSVLVCLLLFRRLSRGMKFQKYRENVLIIRVVLFVIFAIIALYPAINYPQALLFNATGIILGSVLAYFATKHAMFEKREDGLYFKTHVWIEAIVMCLFVVRFAYRFIGKMDMMQNNETPQTLNEKMQYLRDPFTAIIFYIFCTYYIAYFLFIVKEAGKEIKEAK